MFLDCIAALKVRYLIMYQFLASRERFALRMVLKTE